MQDSQHDDHPGDARQLPSGVIPARGTGDPSSVQSHAPTQLDDIDLVRHEVEAWEQYRDNKNAKINWQFTTPDARIKLARLYPTLDG